MRRWEAWWNHAALAAISVTGLLYGIFKYWVPSPDPESRAGHPLQPLWLKSHVLIAPFAVFGVALLLRRHALARIRSGEKNGRRTGVAMLWIFAPLALTGYLIQVLVASGPTHAAGYAHAALGVLFALGYAVHPKRRADTGTDE
ncbi:MAG TPA: hypothetical protein VGH97_11370 [Thermoanaerobaculia bacterium]|jgi:hypothetical protein